MKNKLKYIIILLLAIAIAGRIYYINKNAIKKETVIYSTGEWVELDGDFMWNDIENTKGYSVKLDSAKVYTYEDYMKKYNKPEDYFADSSKFNILELSISLKNEDNTDGGIYIKQFNVFPKNLNMCMYYDTDLVYLSEPKLTDGVTLRPNSEYSLALPYGLYDGRIRSVKTEDTYYLMVSNYPTRKMIRIDL